MRNAFLQTLLELAEKDPRVVLVSPDMGFSVFEPFITRFPERYFNVGIAEQSAIGVAAGLALTGKRPYVYSIVPFVTMRCLEQIRVDLCYMEQPVRLIGVGAGLTYGPAGATHHAIEDLALMRALPNMTVMSPADASECTALIHQAHTLPGPSYLRIGKSGDPTLRAAELTPARLGRIDWITPPGRIAVLATGASAGAAVEWCRHWQDEGLSAGVASVHTLKPLDTDFVRQLIDAEHAILTLEEHSIVGGLGSAIAEVIAESGRAVRFRRIGINDNFTHAIGSQTYLRGLAGLTQAPSAITLHQWIDVAKTERHNQ